MIYTHNIANDNFIKGISNDTNLMHRIVNWLNDFITNLTGTKEQKAYIELRNKYKQALNEIKMENQKDLDFKNKFISFAKDAFDINGKLLSFKEQLNNLFNNLINNKFTQKDAKSRLIISKEITKDRINYDVNDIATINGGNNLQATLYKATVCIKIVITI